MSGISTTSSTRKLIQDELRLANNVSPIMVIAEQEPHTSARRRSRLSREVHRRSRSVEDRTDNQAEHTGSRARSGSPSLPSSDEEGIHRIPSKASTRPKRGSIRRAETPLDPAKSPEIQSTRGSWDTSDLEARIEARLSQMERKNILLEAALMAVITTSASFGSLSNRTPSITNRESAFSARSDMYAPLEEKLEAMISSMHGMQAGGA